MAPSAGASDTNDKQLLEAIQSMREILETAEAPLAHPDWRSSDNVKDALSGHNDTVDKAKEMLGYASAVLEELWEDPDVEEDIQPEAWYTRFSNLACDIMNAIWGRRDAELKREKTRTRVALQSLEMVCELFARMLMMDEFMDGLADGGGYSGDLMDEIRQWRMEGDEET